MAGPTQYPGLSVDVYHGASPLTVNFTGHNYPDSPTVGTWVIDFGDGNGYQEFPNINTFQCTYSSSGTYTVNGAYNDFGTWAFASFDIYVDQPPPYTPPPPVPAPPGGPGVALNGVHMSGVKFG